MDRFEMDAVADADGMVHIHVGRPGDRVHVAVEPTPSEPQIHQVELLRNRLAAMVWPDVPAELVGRRWTAEERESLLGIDVPLG